MKINVRGDEVEAKYLGDGTYIGYRGYDFVIFSFNGLQATNVVYLDPSSIEDLNHFVRQCTNSGLLL